MGWAGIFEVGRTLQRIFRPIAHIVSLDSEEGLIGILREGIAMSNTINLQLSRLSKLIKALFAREGLSNPYGLLGVQLF